MSRQEMVAYGKQEFRHYPLVTLDPLPDQTDIGDYYRRAARGELGVRIKDMDKPLLCGKTAKDYKFWDNLMYHYKNLYPMYDKKVDFKTYTSVHDGWLFSSSKNLKLHNKVCNFEQAQATEVEKRVNLDNPDWVHPCNRRDERYLEDDHELGSMPNPDVKKSRFLKKERKVELSYKDQVEEPKAPEVPRRRRKEAKPLPELKEPVAEEKNTEVERNRHGITVVHFPHDPDDLPAIPRPPPKNVPEYYGWTHSENADSWFLEAHTPSLHEDYEGFYDEALKKRVICPKFYSCVA